MIVQPDRIQIWASQLAANDFPGVCAMSGQPAETWKKFRFSTSPSWVYALLILVCAGGLGIVLYAIINYVVSQKASGHLPLTRASRRMVNLVVGVSAGLAVAWVVSWIAAATIAFTTTDEGLTTIAIILFWLGLLLAIAAVVGRQVVSRLVLPQAKVFEPQPGYLDKVVELRNLHPNFVAAVHQRAVMAAAQPPA